jgi:aspartyl-tRNA(Asn)/glutamyl-tRNA(Gln) amidotransferase subunit A
MTADLAMMPAHQLVKLYKSRKASPVEAVRAAIARIEAFNTQLNAFLYPSHTVLGMHDAAGRAK